MYFGAELIDARAARGLDKDPADPVPVGLIQSAIGGSQLTSYRISDCAVAVL